MSAPEPLARVQPRHIQLGPFLRCATIYALAFGTALGLYLLGGGPPTPWTSWIGLIALVPITLIWVFHLASGRVSGARPGGRHAFLWTGPSPLPRGDALVFTDADVLVVECKGGGWSMRIGLVVFLLVWMLSTVLIVGGFAPPRDVYAAIIAVALVMALTVAIRTGAYPHRVEVPYTSLVEARRDGRRLHFLVRMPDDPLDTPLVLKTSAEHAQATIEALHERGVEVTPGRIVGGAER